MNQSSGKRILVITHQLSRTGAPIVLMDMIRVYQKHGYQIEVITMLDGELRPELEEMKIPVRVQEQFIAQAEEFLQYAQNFQMIAANTLVTFEPVQLLKYTNIPVLWWLHEGRQYFEYFQTVLPDFRNLPPNIHVFSVGHYVQQVIEELYGVRTEILHFGIEDFPVKQEEREEHERVRFLTAGTYSKVKAQDILVEAIQKLPQECLSRAEFYFCGNEKMYDEEVFFPVKQLSESYENVTLLHQLSRKETLKWMERCDCLIAPSRIDPMPTVAAEMMMKENLCLCTDVCGVAHYIEDGVNGFTVPPENADALAEKIEYIVAHNKELDPLRKAGRDIYETYFSMDVFADRIMEVTDCCMGVEKGERGERADMETSGGTKASVIITVYNQKDMLIRCMEWMSSVSGIENIVIADNGSTDGTSDWLSDMGCDYIYFDEGIQGYGKVWNAVVENFDMQEVIIFMGPQYMPGKECISKISEALRQENCGMAGPMSNGFRFLQNMKIDNMEHLCHLEEAQAENETAVFMSLCIEEGIWALSKKALEEAGAFDESLLNSKNVLLDYKMRLVQKGYRFMVCRQAMAYYVDDKNMKLYRSLNQFMDENDRETLKSKWKMNYFHLLPNRNLIHLIAEEREAPIRVLEVGCDLGVTLLEIKNEFPNSQLFGLEINESAAEIAKHIAQVKVGNIEDREIPFEETFDYILFGDVLEHLHDPQGIVKFCREKLNEHGCIISSIPNLMNISVMKQLLNGRFQYEDTGLLDRSHIHFFTYYQILRMFQEEGYTVEDIRAVDMPVTKEDEELIQKLVALSADTDERMYRAFQYVVRARK